MAIITGIIMIGIIMIGIIVAVTDCCRCDFHLCKEVDPLFHYLRNPLHS